MTDEENYYFDLRGCLVVRGVDRHFTPLDRLGEWTQELTEVAEAELRALPLVARPPGGGQPVKHHVWPRLSFRPRGTLHRRCPGHCGVDDARRR